MSSATSAYAVVPSAEIWRAPSSVNGLTTPDDVVARRDVGEQRLGPGLYAGELTPSSACSTIWTVSPACCGNRSSSVSEAACDSDPGCR